MIAISITNRVKTPNFSAPFNDLYNAIIKLFYDDVDMDSLDGVSGGIIRNIYINFSKGLRAHF